MSSNGYQQMGDGTSVLHEVSSAPYIDKSSLHTGPVSSCKILNYTGEPIWVINAVGELYSIDSLGLRGNLDKYVEVVQQTDVPAGTTDYMKGTTAINLEYRLHRRKIPFSLLTLKPYEVLGTGLTIATRYNKDLLNAYAYQTETFYTDMLTQVAKAHFEGQGTYTRESGYSGVAPFLVWANSHDVSINNLYVLVCGVKMRVGVVHLPQFPEGVRVSIAHANEIFTKTYDLVFDYHDPKYQLRRITTDTGEMFEICISTSSSALSLYAAQENMKNMERMSKEEVEERLKVETATLRKELEKTQKELAQARDDLSFQKAETSHYKEQLKSSERFTIGSMNERDKMRESIDRQVDAELKRQLEKAKADADKWKALAGVIGAGAGIITCLVALYIKLAPDK